MLYIEFHRYQQERMNGDRARSTTTCYRYVVVLENDRDPPDCVEAHGFDEYDSYYTSVDTRGKTMIKARAYADDLADVLGLERPKMKKMVKKIVKTESWVEEDEF